MSRTALSIKPSPYPSQTFILPSSSSSKNKFFILLYCNFSPSQFPNPPFLPIYSLWTPYALFIPQNVIVSKPSPVNLQKLPQLAGRTLIFILYFTSLIDMLFLLSAFSPSPPSLFSPSFPCSTFPSYFLFFFSFILPHYFSTICSQRCIEFWYGKGSFLRPLKKIRNLQRELKSSYLAILKSRHRREERPSEMGCIVISS